ncbi:tRNA-specific adenosine deaminase [compost metagenome]
MKSRRILLYIYLACTTIGSLLFIVFNLLLPNWSRIKPKEDVSAYHHLLDSLSRKALSTNDVPVSACLIYRGRVIGVGYNTVYSLGAIGNHAELNALNDATKQIGLDQFRQLHKEELTLITTFEPCLMCRGAAIEAGISHIVSILPKSNADRWKQLKGEWKYNCKSALGINPRFQYDLFKQHPAFDSLQYPFL